MKIDKVSGIYYLVLPYLNYYVEMWENTYPTYTNNTGLLQKRLIRLVFGR